MGLARKRYTIGHRYYETLVTRSIWNDVISDDFEMDLKVMSATGSCLENTVP